MAFNISEITSAINNGGGIAKPSMFFVRITPPQKLALSLYSRDAMFFCDSAQLPGINFTAQPIKSVGYGTTEQRPVDAGFSPINTTFIVDAKGRGLRFFQSWLALINNWSRETTGVMQGTDLAYGEWNYPSDYEGTLEIHALDPSKPEGNEIVVYQLSKAFPLQVGDIAVAWEMNDAIMKLPVVFAYNTWNTANVPPSTSQSISNAPAEYNQVDLQRTGGYGYGVSLLSNGSPSLTQAAEFANAQL